MDSFTKGGFVWPNCTCKRRHDESDSDYFDEDNDSSFTDEESEDESSSKMFFISAYKNAFLKNTIIVSDHQEIKKYILEYSKLTDKSPKNVKKIWENIIVNVPILGSRSITLKSLVEKLFKGPNTKKKQLKRPVPSMRLQNSNSNSLEKLDTNNTSASTVQLEENKDDTKENNNSNKKNTDKNVQEVKKNSIPQSEDKKNNIKTENKSDINNKMANNVGKDKKPNSVNNTPTKNKLESKNESKSSVLNDSKNQTPNNNTKINMIIDQKTNAVNNMPSKVNSENKNENNNKVKSDSANQPNTPKKSHIINKNENIKLTNGISKAASTPDKAVKMNTPKENVKNEIKNSVSEPKTPNVAEKFEKKDLANTPKKTNTVDKNKQTNCNVNGTTKEVQTGPEFKKPLDQKFILNHPGKNSAVKSSNKSSTAEVASKNIENRHEEILDKATKKKLKKQKQKEKKMEGIRRDSCSSRDTTDNSSPDSVNKYVNKTNKIILEELKVTGKKQNEKQLKSTVKNHMRIDTEESEVEKDEDQSKYVKTSDDEVDILTDDENLPAFLANIKEKSKRKEKNKVKADVQTKINSSSTEIKNQSNGNNEQEFIIYSKKRNKTSNRVIDQNSAFYSESFGENACRMISENNFMGALEYLVDAIDFNYADQRHYLNRCYCYLSMKKNALALADAEYIIQISNNIGYLFAANIRAAQASYALQRYDSAEAYMEEAIRINPTSVYALRELILIQVARIASMGFSEKDAVLALEKYSSVKGALNYLIENNADNLNNFKKDLEISIDNNDEFLYSSDEDEPSNAEVINRMLNYEPGTITLQHIVAKPANAHLITCDNNKSIKKDKKVVPYGKANSGQEKAIWVGNLTANITDTMLKKKFKEFGKVTSVYHPLNEGYAFINFERAEDVTNVLTNTSCHEIAGVKLLVKSAIRQKYQVPF